MNDILYREWISDNPNSFGGVYHTYEKYRDLSKKQIDSSFHKNDIYTRFRQFRKAKFHNPVIVYKKRDQFQSDICYFNNDLLIHATGGYRYLLCTIDIFTKYVWVFPLKNISGLNVSNCMEKLFKEERPKNLCTDAGSEFLNKYVKKIVNKYNVKHFVARNRTKAQVVERFILTLQRLLYQLMTHHNTHDWRKVLPKAMKIYLNRKHRTIKMSPNAAELLQNQGILERIHKDRVRKIKTKKAKFKKGEQVRISLLRTKFTRGYHQSFTTEIWRIKEVLTNLPLPRYKVSDENGDELTQILNENELIKYEPQSDIYQIERVLKTRGRGNKRQFFVKWMDYPISFNSWVKEQDVLNIE